MRDFTQVPLGAKTYHFVGDYALYISGFDEIKVNVSDYYITFTTTTENPDIGTYM